MKKMSLVLAAMMAISLFLPGMALADEKVPVIGVIMHNSAIARFARTLGVTFKAGVPLVEALDIVAGATGSGMAWSLRPRSWRSMTSPPDSASARCSRFSSSRTLPGKA